MIARIEPDPKPEPPPAWIVLDRLARRHPVWVPAIEMCLDQARREIEAEALAKLLGKPVEAAGDVPLEV